MKAIIFGLVLVAILIFANAAPSIENVEMAWQKFKLDNKKQYRDLREETLRKAIFSQNFNKISKHNELYLQGTETFSLQINKFADMTSEEISKTSYGYQASKTEDSDIEIATFVPDENVDIPDEFDWSQKGAVTPVKDQGGCGSCWAFSATGALEAQYFLKTGKLISMSEQNLIDCSGEYGNAGCAGGDMAPSFTYIHDADAIDSEDGYPYEGVNNTCRFDPATNVTSLKGYVNIEPGNEDHLKAAIATQGPISVAIDASSFFFQFYRKGIFYTPHCLNGTDVNPFDLDHAVLAVGYGSEDGVDYWLLKNSWGSLWGIDGYMKLARNMDNQCGIAAEASFPINY